METNLLEMAGILVSAILPVFVFSYLLGDNVLYRRAEHIFVGVALGYVVVVAFHTILASKLPIPMAGALSEGDGEQALLLTALLILGLFLVTRPLKALSWLGNFGIAVFPGEGGLDNWRGVVRDPFAPSRCDSRYHTL